MNAKGTACWIGLLMVLQIPALATQPGKPKKTTEAGAASPASPQEVSVAAPQIRYLPPNLGAPRQRVGGGTRGICQLCVLAPPHVAITTQAQPRLYWFLAPGFRNEIRFRLGEAGSRLPLLEIVLPANINGGIQHLDLASYNLWLEPDKLYEWSITIEPKPHQRWLDLVSTGRIILDAHAQALDQLPASQRPFVAARKGYWYDALDALSRLLEKTQNKGYWRAQRATLLEQGGLARVASEELVKANAQRH